MVELMGTNIAFVLRFALRVIVSFLDGLIYTIDAEVYNLVLKIAQAEVFKDTTITEIAGRVYQLVALIMMFRLIFTFVTYVINPDDIADKKKGVGNIAKKMVITLALIIITPWAFQQARNIQTVIFEDGVIEHFVFGEDSSSAASEGYRLMNTVGKLFIRPYQCKDLECKAIDGDKQVCPESNWDTMVSVNAAGKLTCSGSECLNSCSYGVGNDENFGKELYKATKPNGAKYDLNALAALGRFGNGKNNSSDFYVEYRLPFVGSTLVGVIIGFMLVSMCIDIAVRTIKLAFYEIISPIPIISYIGLKDGKDSMLNKWLNQVLKTYLDLFIRVGGLQLAIFFIDTMLEEGIADNDFYVKVFLLIGALTFAKKLPDILKDLGLNLDTGGFSLKKKLEPAMSMIRPITGAAAGAIGGMAANAQASSAVGRGLIRTGASTVGGALTGAMRGAAAGAKQKNGLGLGAGFGAAGKSGQKIYNSYGTDGGRYIDRARATMGLKTEAEVYDEEIKIMDTYSGFKKQMKDNADFYNSGISVSSIGDATKNYATSTNAAAISAALSSGGVKAIKQYYEDLQSSGTASQAEISAARSAYEDAQQYVISNNLSQQVNYIKDQAARYVKANRRVLTTQSDDAMASWKDLNSGFIDASNKATEIRTSEEYTRAQYNKNWAQSGKSKK